MLFEVDELLLFFKFGGKEVVALNLDDTYYVLQIPFINFLVAAAANILMCRIRVDLYSLIFIF